MRSIQTLSILVALLTVQGNMLDCLAQDAASVEAAQMLDRGDSLLQLGKPVAALSMYRGAEERSFDPCLIARARMGIAEVHVESHNPEQASSALNLASSGLLACGTSNRLELTILAADLWLLLQQEERANGVLRREIKMHPNDLQLHSRLAKIAFISGEWISSREALNFCLTSPEATPTNEQTAEWLSYLVQLNIIENRSPNDSILRQFHSAASLISIDLAQDHRKQIYQLFALEDHHLLAYEWAEKILTFTPKNDLKLRSKAQLQLAQTAIKANRQLEAVIGFHEAIKTARSSNDMFLLAEVLRQRALFEDERSNPAAALQAMFEVDSIQSALLLGLSASEQNQIRGFKEHLLPEPDPFERAVANLEQSQANRPDLGLWPWIAALLAIGLLAMNRSYRLTQYSLKKERRRLIRLRSLVPSDRLHSGQEPSTEQEGAPSSRSIMPNGTFVFTHDDNPYAQSIQTFMSELDEDIKSSIAWELADDLQLTIGPDVRVALRNLIRGFIELSHDQQDVQVQIEQLDAHWKFSISSDHTEASKALRGLFYGKDALASSRWNELHAQLRKLTGKIQIERITPVREKLSVILPTG